MFSSLLESKLDLTGLNFKSGYLKRATAFNFSRRANDHLEVPMVNERSRVSDFLFA